MEFTAKQIAGLIGGDIIGNEEEKVNSFSKIEEGKKGAITFLANPKYESYIYNSEASIIVREKTLQLKKEINNTQIVVEDAHESFTKLLMFYYEATKTKKSKIEQPSFVHESAKLEGGNYVGAFSYISENVFLAKDVQIYPNCFIGEKVKIGKGSIVYPGAVVFRDTVIGENCVISSNTTIGSDGFGYVRNKEGVYGKVPQLGSVIIEDNVEVGSGCTIDRATMGVTLIKKGTKLDNQIQVAHNVEVGENTVVASQTGIAGSTKVGNNVIIGGQVGIAGHLNIGNNVMVQAQSGIGRNIPADQKLYGSPAIDQMDYKKSYVYFRKFPEIVKRLDKLEEILKFEKTDDR